MTGTTVEPRKTTEQTEKKDFKSAPLTLGAKKNIFSELSNVNDEEKPKKEQVESKGDEKWSIGRKKAL